MIIELSTPIKTIDEHGNPNDITSVELPDDLTVGVVRAIGVMPSMAQAGAFSYELLVKTKALSGSDAQRISNADTHKFIAYFSSMQEEKPTRVKQPDANCFVLGRMRFVNADPQTQPIEWAAQVMQHVGMMKSEDVNAMELGELLTLLPELADNAYNPKIVSTTL